MTTTTHARLKRTAVEAVGSIPGIEAVVLYGSRARGTARVASDWDIAIRELDGKTQIAHVVRYHASPVEWPERTAKRMGATMRLQTGWLRWYAERTPEFRDAAVAAGAEIADAASVIDGMRGFDRLDPELRAQAQAWDEDGRSIAAAFGRGNVRGLGRRRTD